MKSHLRLLPIFLILVVAALFAAPLSKAADVTVTAIQAVGANSFFLTSDGILWGMGDNSYGQLGSRAATTPSTLALNSSVSAVDWAMDRGVSLVAAIQSTPVQIASNVDSMAGGETLLWVTKDGELWGMGDNFCGILGDGTYRTIRRAPVHIASNVTAVTSSGMNSLFLTKDGKLWGMGYNNDGELGESTLTGPVTRANQGYGTSSTPVQVASDVIAMFGDSSRTMFLTSDHTLWGMGSNGGAENTTAYNGSFLGLDASGFDNNYRQYIPVQIASNVDSIRNREGLVTVDGELYQIRYGQLVLVSIPSGEKVISAFRGNECFSLCVTENGNLWAQGDNYGGELGVGEAKTLDSPVLVASNVAMATIGRGEDWVLVYGDDGAPIAFGSNYFAHSLFVTKDGKLWGMGSNNYGQLGIGVTTGIVPYPVQIQIPDPAEITKTIESNVSNASNASSTTESSSASSGNASAAGGAGAGGSAGGGAPSLLYLASAFALLALRRFKRR